MPCNIVTTLGPEGTCSELVLLANLSRFGEAAILKLFASYELAALAVVEGVAQFALVAAAYPELNTLVFDPVGSLRIVDCFVADTPPLVIAGRSGVAQAAATIAAVGAPSPLVRRTFPGAVIVPAKSNADAAELAADGLADAAFTTAPAAARCGLITLQHFGSVPMAWVVFGVAPPPKREPDLRVASLPLLDTSPRAEPPA